MATLAYFLLVCCGPNFSSSSSESYTTTCSLPSDETATLEGAWSLQPVPLALHVGDFAENEAQDMTAAADTWNAFFQASKGFTIFEYGGDPNNPRTSTLANPGQSASTESIISGQNFSAPVVIYKDYTWPYGSDIIALTTFNTTTTALPETNPDTGTPIYGMDMAIIEVNYQDFFINGNKVPDLQTILLHELGHVAGLKHTCEVTGYTGMPTCDPNSTDEYNAVMAPVFPFDQSGNGIQKRSLTNNDEGRANCLYQWLTPNSS